MPILKVKGIELYYEEYGEGDRYVIQAQQFINSHLNYVKDLAVRRASTPTSSASAAMRRLH